MYKTHKGRDCRFHGEVICELRAYLAKYGSFNIIGDCSKQFTLFLEKLAAIYHWNYGKDVWVTLKETDILSLFILYLIALVPEGSIENNIPRFRCICNISKKEMSEKLKVTRQSYGNLEAGRTSLMNVNIYRTARILKDVLDSNLGPEEK